MKRAQGAVAVDLGATSARFAAGWLEDSRLRHEIIEQVPHAPRFDGKHLVWDLDALLGICRRAIGYAGEHFDDATVGIDSWGVDHGFLDVGGNLLGPPICYRDPSHEAALKSIDHQQPHLYRLTGIQRQPFNTICQLVARRKEDPTLPSCATWLILPDLLGYLLTGARGYELTQASTTQLMGLDQHWCAEAFDIAGWPVPELPPVKPGAVMGKVDSVGIVRVGSHDTASAVFGFGDLPSDHAYLNVGTWSILGSLLASPLVSEVTEAKNWSNEIAVDGRARFLKNVPGFYVLNRLHDELGSGQPMGAWLEASALSFAGRFDVFDESLYNPASMPAACAALLSPEPKTEAEWAGAALGSLVDALAVQTADLRDLAGDLSLIRVGGGGSQSGAFCQAIADKTGLRVEAGPAEATVIGNLAFQFQSRGIDIDLDQAYERKEYRPR